MRFSGEERIEAQDFDKHRTQFKFDNLVKDTTNTIYVGLVGGSDPASMAVRRAQSFLRFDRRPSYFSEIFLFSGSGSDILECKVVDADPKVPEGGGISTSKASHYHNAKAYPNSALIGFQFRDSNGGTSPSERVLKVLKAANDQKAIRERYDLWQMLAIWQPYLFEPDRTPNPLSGGAPHPGAAFVRWALGAAEIEAAPGALDEFDAPEHFWAAANYWHGQYAQRSVGVEISLVRSITDPLGTVSAAAKDRTAKR